MSVGSLWVAKVLLDHGYGIEGVAKMLLGHCCGIEGLIKVLLSHCYGFKGSRYDVARPLLWYFG